RRYLFLIREQIESERGVDRRETEIVCNTLLMPSPVIRGSTIEILDLTVGFPFPLINCAGQSKRFLISRGLQVFDFCKNFESTIVASICRLIWILIRAERLLLRQFQTERGLRRNFGIHSRAAIETSRVAERSLRFQSISQPGHFDQSGARILQHL